MRIQHNVMAMNAYRNYTNNVSAMKSNLEKLSSGYKINRAGDDAAGLAISEKMRAQITGLETAQKNAKDGISLVQTAEGALTEVHDMLNRMVELASQSANGTYDNTTDRAQMQKEIEQLKDEIDRIADSSNFNGINLLDGSMSIRGAGSKTVSVEGMDRIIKTVIGEADEAYTVPGNKTILDEVGVATGTAGTIQINLAALAPAYIGTGTKVDASGFTLTLNIGGTELELTNDASISATATIATILGALDIGTDVATKASATDGFVTIQGVDWYVASCASGVLTLTMKQPPTTASEAKTNFDVKVSYDADDYRLNLSTNIGVYTSTVPTIQGGGQTANTVFELKESDIVDGAKITLGNKTIAIALGADSKVKKTGNINAVANLTGMEAGKIDMNKALQAISQAFGSTITASLANGQGVMKKATFNVGVNDGTNGGPVGLTVQRTTAAADAQQSAVFNTLEKLAGIFSYSRVEKWDRSNGLTLQIGPTSDSFNQLNVSVSDCHVEAIGIGDVDISTQEGAQKAVDQIKAAINYVSDVRGTLGATQNRLDHTINNLSVMTENIQDAESTIRDTDVAEEMMAYTKNNILIQSAQAMLAQANQVPQGVLQLLQ